MVRMRAMKGAHLTLDGVTYEVLEAKTTDGISWPVYSVRVFTSTINLRAAGESVTTLVYGDARNESGEQVRQPVELRSQQLTVTRKSGADDPYNQISYSFNASGQLVFTGAPLGTNQRPQATAIYELAWTGKNVSILVTVVQEANVATVTPRHNETTAYRNLVFWMSSAISEVPVGGGLVTVYGTRVYNVIAERADYTSGAHTGGETISTGNIENYVAPNYAYDPTGHPNQYVAVSPAPQGIQGGVINFDDNQQQTDPIEYRVFAYYEDPFTHQVFSPTTTIDQEADSYTTTTEVRNYEATIAPIGTIGLTPTGGSCRLDVSATHEERTRYNWASGGYTYSDWRTVGDPYTISKSGTGAAYFTVSYDSIGPVVQHADMARRPSDRVVFTVTNDGDHTTSASTSEIVVQQTITTTTQNFFGLESDMYDVPYVGDTATLSYVAVLQTRISYQSQQPDDVSETDLLATLVASLGTLSESGIQGRGTVTLTIPENTAYTGRSSVVQLYYNSESRRTITINQEAAPRPLVDYIRVEDTPSSSGRTTTVFNTYTAALTTTITITLTSQATGVVVQTRVWTGTVPASGQVQGPSFIYGYGYDFTYTVDSASL